MTQVRNRLGACGCGKFSGEAVQCWEALLHHPLACFLCLAKGHLFHLSCLGDGWSWMRDVTSALSLGCASSGSWQTPGRCLSTQVVLHSPTVLIHQAELHKNLRVLNTNPMDLHGDLHKMFLPFCCLAHALGEADAPMMADGTEDALMTANGTEG